MKLTGNKEYVLKIGIGTSDIDGQNYATMMLDHIDLDSLLRTASIFELIKPTLNPLTNEHPLFFGEPTDIMGVDDELKVSIKKVKKIITISIESKSTLDDVLEKVDAETLKSAQRNLPPTFFEFNRGKKFFEQQATMVYSGIYKDAYRNFLNAYEEKGFYYIILGDDGKAMPGVQLIKTDLSVIS